MWTKGTPCSVMRHFVHDGECHVCFLSQMGKMIPKCGCSSLCTRSHAKIRNTIMTFEPTPLNIALVVLVAAAIWAIVELALTIRKARTTIDELTVTANETIGQAQPIIGKVDGLMDDIQPSVKELQPLLEQLGTTLEEANGSLGHVNSILGDVSSVGETATSVTDTVKNVATTAANGVAAAVNRITGRAAAKSAALVEATAQAPVEEDPISAAPADNGYVTYGSDAE